MYFCVFSIEWKIYAVFIFWVSGLLQVYRLTILTFPMKDHEYFYHENSTTNILESITKLFPQPQIFQVNYEVLGIHTLLIKSWQNIHSIRLKERD